MSQTLSTAVLPRPVGSTWRPAGSGAAGLALDLLSLAVALVFVLLYAVVALAVLAGRLVVRWGRRVLETHDTPTPASLGSSLSPSQHRP